jgi:hypothetical protein
MTARTLGIPSKTTVQAVVHASAAVVERGEEHDPTAVDGILHLLGRGEYLIEQGGIVTLQKNRSVLETESAQRARLLDDLLHTDSIGLARLLQHADDLAFVDDPPGVG